MCISIDIHASNTLRHKLKVLLINKVTPPNHTHSQYGLQGGLRHSALVYGHVHLVDVLGLSCCGPLVQTPLLQHLPPSPHDCARVLLADHTLLLPPGLLPGLGGVLRRCGPAHPSVLLSIVMFRRRVQKVVGHSTGFLRETLQCVEITNLRGEQQ